MPDRPLARFAPVLVLGVGAALLLKVHAQEAVPLPHPLDSLPQTIAGYSSRGDVTISPEEQAIAGMTNYVFRLYARDSADFFSLYVGYYEAQTQGKSIHSPKNCLPGGGWEPVSADTAVVAIGGRREVVNRYLLENQGQRALVLYWYQGRGRVAWNEYAVKWDLLRDKALHGRSEEALVRIVVPIRPGREGGADSTARQAAGVVIPDVERLLPPARGATPQ